LQIIIMWWNEVSGFKQIERLGAQVGGV